MYNKNCRNPYYGRSYCSQSHNLTPYAPIYDYGPNPLIFNLRETVKNNQTFRTSLWTGTYFQLTVMCINPGEDIGLEVHNTLDQFIRIEEGTGMVKMGSSETTINYSVPVTPGYSIIIPAGIYHNLINTGTCPIKLYSIYALPEHPFNTVHLTKEDAIKAEEEHHK